MPTHQGSTETIIIFPPPDDDDDEATQTTNFEFEATYTGAATLEVADLAPKQDRRYTDSELVLRDATGAPIATFAARYKAWVDRGSATTQKRVTLTDSYVPVPDGDSPVWPISFASSAHRSWKVDTFDPAGGLFAQQWLAWEVRTTMASSTGIVAQSVTDQTDGLLRVQLVYMEGANVLLTVVATITASASVGGGVTADPPDVTDLFSP